MTLTLESTSEPLVEQIDHLIASFRRLRRQARWARNVKGGVYTIEVTRSATTGLWHPHLHVLVEGSYYSQADLKEDWRLSTGGSFVVWITAVPSRSTAARYIAKYTAKPTDLRSWPPAAICEFAHDLHGRRLMHTFGSLHNVEPEPAEEVIQPKVTDVLCTRSKVAQLWHRQAADVRDAVCILAAQGPAWHAALETWIGEEFEPAQAVTADHLGGAIDLLRDRCSEEADEAFVADVIAGTGPPARYAGWRCQQMQLIDVAARR